jgi:hypothetical protein
VIPAVMLAFSSHPSRPVRLALVIFSYFSTILMFATFYFFVCCSSDCGRASAERAFLVDDLYDKKPDGWEKMDPEDFLDRVDMTQFDRWALLRGVSSHAVKGVLDSGARARAERRPPGRPWIEYLRMEPLVEDLKAQKFPSAQVDHESRIPLWIECFHFSVVTAATIGYGEISPSTTFIRIVVDIQILASTAILVIGLGLALSGPEDNSDSRRRWPPRSSAARLPIRRKR